MKTILTKQEILELKPLPRPDVGTWVTVESDVQTIGARVHEPDETRDERQIILDDCAWGVNASTGFDVMRTSQIAKSSGLLTIALETPQMSDYSGPLTDAQMNAIKTGDWSVLGEAQWKIINSILESRGIEYSEDNPITVHYAGYSLAASTLIGVLESAPMGVKTGHFVAWENVAIVANASRIKRLRRVAAMMIGFPYSGLGMRHYRKQSETVPGHITEALQSELEDDSRKAIPRSFKATLKGMAAPITAMSHGGDATKLRDAIIGRGEQGTAFVHLWHGEKSRLLSTKKANKYGAGLLEAAGIAVDVQHDSDGGHNVEDLLPLAVPRYAEAFASPLPMVA